MVLYSPKEEEREGERGGERGGERERGREREHIIDTNTSTCTLTDLMNSNISKMAELTILYLSPLVTSVFTMGAKRSCLTI